MSIEANKPIPLRLPPTLIQKIEHAAGQMKKSNQEVMRIAMTLGLLDLEQMDYDMEGVAWHALQGAKVRYFEQNPLPSDQKEPTRIQAPKPGHRKGVKPGGKSITGLTQVSDDAAQLAEDAKKGKPSGT